MAEEMTFPIQSVDVFGKQITDPTSSELDIASHYQYSPERWRVFRGGSRQFPEYGSVSGFTDNADHFLLEPAQGETLSMETAESPRYTVQYALFDTFATQISRQMESGDRVRLGMFNGSDGWFYEKNDTHAKFEVDLVTFRQGSQVNSKTETLNKALTDGQTRLSIRTPWYDVGRQLWGQSYSENGFQKNETVGRTSLDSERGPDTGNLPILYEVKRGSGSSSLSLEVGSCSVVTLGPSQGRFRVKKFKRTVNLDATGNWVPLLALRSSPDQDNVNVQQRKLEVVEFGANDDVEATIKAFDPSKVADSGGNQLVDSDFSSPNVLQTQTSSIEVTEAVDQVADSSGTLQTSMTSPGGFQVGYSLLTTDKRSQPPESPDAKQNLTSRDIAVVMAKSGSTGDVTFAITLEEDW